MKPNIGQGDKGMTFVFGSGKRIRKDHVQIEALGALDELNSFIGFARAIDDNKEINQLLTEIQRNLFVAGAVLATEKGYEKHKMIPLFTKKTVVLLEEMLQKYEKNLPELKNFILPSGTSQAAALHVCRSLARTAERRVVTFSRKRKINPHVMAYLNRLSDLFLAMARHANQQAGRDETIWKGTK